MIAGREPPSPPLVHTKRTRCAYRTLAIRWNTRLRDMDVIEHIIGTALLALSMGAFGVMVWAGARRG